MKPPIHDTTAERLLLSCCMQCPIAAGNVRDKFVKKQPFIDRTCQVLWSAFIQAGKDEWDMFDLLAFCPKGIDWLAEQRAIYSEALLVNAEKYLAKVEDLSIRRSLIKNLARAQEVIQEGANLDELLPKVVSQLNIVDTLEGDRGDDISTKEATDEEIARSKLPGGELKTCMPKLDKVIGELEPGSVFVVAARPSKGKSVIASVIAKRNAERGNSIGFITLEMTPAQQGFRMYAAEGRINNMAVKNLLKEGDAKAIAAKEAVDKLPIVYAKKSGFTIDMIESTARKWKRKFGIKFLVLDHFNLLRTAGRNRSQEMNAAAERFKTLCRELDVVGIQLVQINRAGEDLPTMANLKEAGGIEEAADYIIALASEGLTPDQVKSLESDGGYPLFISVLKNRHGPKDVIEVVMYPQFSDVDASNVSDVTFNKIREMGK